MYTRIGLTAFFFFISFAIFSANKAIVAL